MVAGVTPNILPQVLAARQAANAPQVAGKSAQLRQNAEDFEQVFLVNALKTMFSGLETDGPFGGGFGEEMFREFLVEEYASNIVKAGGVGVADEVYRQMLALQEVKQ